MEKPHTSASTAATWWPRLGQRDREVGGDRRLAHAALARRHRDDPGAGVGERVLPGRRLLRLRRVDHLQRVGRRRRRRRRPSAGDPAQPTRRRSCRGRRRRPVRCPPASPTDSTIRRRSSAREASPGSGTATATTAVRPSTATPCTMPSSTIDRRSSGSSTAASAAWTSSGSGVDAGIRGSCRISTIGIGRIRAMDGRRPHRATSSPRWSARSRTRSATPPAAEIYLFVRESRSAGVTAGEVAEHFELHPNVARHHLEKLTAGGYLIVEVGRGRRSGGARPVARRSATSRVRSTPPLELPLKHDDLLGALLARALDAARTRTGRGAGRRSRASTTAATLAARMDPDARATAR